MFSGTTSAIATVASITRGNGTLFTLTGLTERDVAILTAGDRILVNGQSGRVSSLDASKHSIQIETEKDVLERSALKDSKAGQSVNLEFSKASPGWHTVRGRADAVCRVVAVNKLDGIVVVLSLVVEERGKGGKKTHGKKKDDEEEREEEPQLESREDLHRGSLIALDGVFLSILDSDGERGTFDVAVPGGLATSTTLGQLKPGDKTSLEVDAISRLVRHEVGKAKAAPTSGKEKQKEPVGLLEKVAKGTLKAGESAAESVVAAIAAKVVKNLVKEELGALLKGKL